jgi:hypothetical protein
VLAPNEWFWPKNIVNVSLPARQRYQREVATRRFTGCQRLESYCFISFDVAYQALHLGKIWGKHWPREPNAIEMYFDVAFVSFPSFQAEFNVFAV